MGSSGYLCGRCNDSGWVHVTRQNGTTAVMRCDGDPCPYMAAKYGFAIDVPADERKTVLAKIRVVKAKGDDAGNVDALEQARHFVDGAYRGMYLYGPPGRGKSMLACAMLNECMKRRQMSRFVAVPELLRSWISDEDDEFERLLETEIVCLDDIGAQQGSDYARRTLYMVFDGRDRRGKRTIVTSNLDLDQLTEFLQDDRLSSRIAGSCKIVEVGGPDHRLEGPKVRRVEKKPAAPKKHW